MSRLRFEDKELLKQHLDSLMLERPLAHITSLPALDALLGGIREGSLTVISGGPGSGKTTLAHQIALDICGQGVPVIFAEFEMGIPQLVLKGISRLSGGRVAVTDLPDSTRLSDEALRAVSSYEERARLMAYSTDASDIVSLSKLVGDCANQVGRAPVLVVDYLQLIDASEKRSFADERLEIKATIRGLRSLATAYGAGVVAISSINRQNYTKSKVGLDAMGGSSYIEYSADVVTLLRRLDDDLSKAPSNRKMSFAVLKNRYGATGEVRLSFDTAHATFGEA
ncbi:MAG: DnaB helicase C-terminal domain-containing protein [Olsenella sp.]|nr:DnaB helicase C-terminal domain-containing protein [Olsenella sp.]